MTGREKVYRAASAVLCATFALVGAIFLLAPDLVLRFFDGWSARLGLDTFDAPADPFFLVLAVAYMCVVTGLAWSMYRNPRDAWSARLLAHAKMASSALSFAVFLMRERHLVLLLNGVVDGAIAVLVVLMWKRLIFRPERAA